MNKFRSELFNMFNRLVSDSVPIASCNTFRASMDPIVPSALQMYENRDQFFCFARPFLSSSTAWGVDSPWSSEQVVLIPRRAGSRRWREKKIRGTRPVRVCP